MHRRMTTALARSQRRPLAAFAALAFAATGLAIVVADQHPAEAQTVTATSLVKNTGQTPYSGTGGDLSSFQPENAQGFTTGTDAVGYVLDSIGIDFLSIHANSDPGNELTVTLATVQAGSASIPDSNLCTLANPATFGSSGVQYFDAPTTGSSVCPRLTANTTYVVRVVRANNTSQTIRMDASSAAAEDSGAATGWSIANDRARLIDSWLDIEDDVFLIDVRGHANSAATGAPTITGTPEVGQVLTADTSGITDANGLTGVEYRYQWYRVTNGSQSLILNATDSTYTLRTADRGKSIRVRVHFTDAHGFDEVLNSAAVAVTQNANPTGAPVVSGAPQVGQILRAVTSEIADGDGLTTPAFVYRWIRTTDGTDTDIAGATAQTYTPNAEDLGSTIKVRVSFTDNGNTTETLTSAATGAVLAAAAPGSRLTSDISLHGDNGNPTGVWGNSETIWVANNNASGTTSLDKVFAYRRSDGNRDAAKDFDGLDSAGNHAPTGICSDGTTMFVIDHTDRRAYAYKMSDRTRDTSKDMVLDAANSGAEGAWCDATTVWVSNDGGGVSSKIYAYKRSDGSRDTSNDFDELHLDGFMFAANNSDPRGLWSNGETMFAVDREDAAIYAYKFSDKSENVSLRLALDAGNAHAYGTWFDGRVLWVADSDDDMLYAYDLPGAHTARQFWSGTAVVAEHKDFDQNNNNKIGYSADAAEYPSSTLDDADFDYGPTAYSLDALSVRDVGAPGQNFLDASMSPAAEQDVWNQWETGHRPQHRVQLPVFSHRDSGQHRRRHGGLQVGDAARFRQRRLGGGVVAGESVAGHGRTRSGGRPECPPQAERGRVGHLRRQRPVNRFVHIVPVDPRRRRNRDRDSGRHNATYYPTSSDVDKQIKVRVTFDDHAGFEEYPLTSEASDVIGAALESAASATQVSNSGQTRAGTPGYSPSTWRGQAFTTGPNSFGYVLDSAGVYLSFEPLLLQSHRRRTKVTLHEIADDDLPGEALCTLTDPGFFPDAAVATFDAPSGCPTLAADTAYAVVVSMTAGVDVESKVGHTSSADEDTLDPATGWTIADQRLNYSVSSDRWTTSSNSSLLIDIDAAPNIGSLVRNTGQSALASTDVLDSSKTKRAQAFTTGANPGGYGLGSIGIDFATIHADSQPASELTVTLNATAPTPVMRCVRSPTRPRSAPAGCSSSRRPLPATAPVRCWPHPRTTSW